MCRQLHAILSQVQALDSATMCKLLDQKFDWQCSNPLPNWQILHSQYSQIGQLIRACGELKSQLQHEKQLRQAAEAELRQHNVGVPRRRTRQRTNSMSSCYSLPEHQAAIGHMAAHSPDGSGGGSSSRSSSVPKPRRAERAKGSRVQLQDFIKHAPW